MSIKDKMNDCLQKSLKYHPDFTNGVVEKNMKDVIELCNRTLIQFGEKDGIEIDKFYDKETGFMDSIVIEPNWKKSNHKFDFMIEYKKNLREYKFSITEYYEGDLDKDGNPLYIDETVVKFVVDYDKFDILYMICGLLIYQYLIEIIDPKKED
jgi:hypothetical protein